MKQYLKKYRYLAVYFIVLFVVDALIDVLVIKQPITWGYNALLCLFTVAVIWVLDNLFKLILYSFKKKNRCEGCKYNDKAAADDLFVTMYCSLKDCPVSGKYRCKYKISTRKKWGWIL
jgi:hypothetical protein